MICVLCISTSHQPYQIEDLATEGNIMSWKKYQKPRWMLYVGCLRWALVISDDLVDSDGSHDCGTWLEKTLHELERYTNGKPQTLKITSRKVKTHHLQNRTYFFWVPAVHLLFGSFIYRQFINHLDRQARLRRSRVLSWMLGGFFVFFGWRLVHPKGWLTP